VTEDVSKSLFNLAFEDAKTHARQQFPKESCGLIVAGNYIACENVAAPVEEHKEGDDNCGCQLCSFQIDPQVYLKHADKIDFVVHSHPNGPLYPSRADMEGQLQTGVPWAIIALDEDRVGDPLMWGDSLPIAPLVGRPFMHGVHDCYSLIRDCYRLGKDELAKQDIPDWPYEPILLPTGVRDDGWWEKGEDLYDRNFPLAGFIEIPETEVRPGDVFLMKIRSEQFNHGGLLISNDLILHHLPLRLSRREPAGLWGRQAGRWLRYVGPLNVT